MAAALLGRAAALPPGAVAAGGRRPGHLALRGGGKAAPPTEAPAAVALPPRGFIARSFDALVLETFEAIDTNKDGKVDVHEAHVLVLALYLKLNRQAPVEPPTLDLLQKLFKAVDTDKSGKLSKEEFCKLATRLCATAFFRVAAHKFITIVGGPLCAAYVARKISGDVTCATQCSYTESGTQLSGLMLLIISNLKLVLTIVFVCSLGNVFLNILDVLLGYRTKKNDGGKTPAAAGKK